MEKYYRFAGIDLAIEIDDARMYENDLQLGAFRVDRADAPHRYTVAADAIAPPGGRELICQPGFRIYQAPGGYVRYQVGEQKDPTAAFFRAEHRGKTHRVTIRRDQVPGTISARLVLNALDVEHLVASSGGVILHASFIQWQGQAILFTAPSETGKTTQAELWKEFRSARVINGDRAVILEKDGVFHASGLPFSGSSRYCGNCTIPLAAVVYLRQAPATSIRRLRGVESFCRVWEGCCVNSWHQEDVQAATGLVQKLIGCVDIYELSCTPDETAVNALEQQLRRQVNL